MQATVGQDASIGYDLHGQGPPLVLINGMGFGRWGWFKQVPALSRRLRVITFDFREGHGSERGPENDVRTLASDAVALLDHLGVGRAHVLGSSLGGFVAQELALERPDLVDRLVLVCTSHGGRGSEPMSVSALGGMSGLGSLTPEGAARRGLETATSETYRREHPDEFEEILRRRLADSPPLSSYFGQAAAGARFDASGEVGRITSPTLVIHGAEDRYVPVANAEALAEAIPGATLRVLDDAGHLVFIERSAAVNEAVIDFLGRREPRRPGTGEGRPENRGTGEERGGQGLAEQVQEQNVSIAHKFFGESLGAIKSKLQADRAELESVAAHFPHEGVRQQIQMMVASYWAIEESLDRAAQSVGVDIKDEAGREPRQA